MPYQWDGEKILQRNTGFRGIRTVIGRPEIDIYTDLRQLLTGPDMAEIRKTLKCIDALPLTKNPGDFDGRAGLVWKWVAEHIDYTSDYNSQQRVEFYQFPGETIALGSGDCEDIAFLLASLLIASGISEYCVRTVLGYVKWSSDRVRAGHAWVIYKDETGVWRILEPTLKPENLPNLNKSAAWPVADTKSKRGARPWYVPNICFNQSHIWAVGKIESDDVEHFVMSFKATRNRPAYAPGGL